MTRDEYPKCATCGHWLPATKNEPQSNWGRCRNTAVSESVGCGTVAECDPDFYPNKDFGCIYHTSLDTNDNQQLTNKD